MSTVRTSTGLALVFALLFVVVAGPPAAAARRAQNAAGPGGLCDAAIAATETRERLPKGLLKAIALVESGRWDKARAEKVAWPWTVNAERRGRYFDTKAAAVAAVRKLQAEGVTNIDVGCMQVNLQYHGENFASIAAALDPATNAAYAARFLKSLYADKGSWSLAVAHYHSATRKLNIPYRSRVYREWSETLADSGPARSATVSSPRRASGRLRTPSAAIVAATRNRLPAQASRAPRGRLLSILRPAVLISTSTSMPARRDIAAGSPATVLSLGRSAGAPPALRRTTSLSAPRLSVTIVPRTTRRLASASPSAPTVVRPPAVRLDIGASRLAESRMREVSAEGAQTRPVKTRLRDLRMLRRVKSRRLAGTPLNQGRKGGRIYRQNGASPKTYRLKPKTESE